MSEKIESIRKWMFAIEKDLRIAVIKIADRTDNLISLHVFDNPEKRMRIAQETLDIYAKVAEWLSMEDLKKELEEKALPHVLSEERQEIFDAGSDDFLGKPFQEVELFEMMRKHLALE